MGLFVSIVIVMAEHNGQPVEWATGSRTVFKTDKGEEISGVVFAHDRNTNCLLLKETGSHSGVCNLRFVNVEFIKEIVSHTPPNDSFDTKLPAVDLERCKRREEKALKQAEAEASKVGVGVTNEAQSIFDALSKTMPCRWRNKTIIVLEEVHIESPYDINCCSSDENHKPTLERVRKVLQAERFRLGLHSN